MERTKIDYSDFYVEEEETDPQSRALEPKSTTPYLPKVLTTTASLEQSNEPTQIRKDPIQQSNLSNQTKEQDDSIFVTPVCPASFSNLIDNFFKTFDTNQILQTENIKNARLILRSNSNINLKIKTTAIQIPKATDLSKLVSNRMKRTQSNTSISQVRSSSKSRHNTYENDNEVFLEKAQSPYGNQSDLT